MLWFFVQDSYTDLVYISGGSLENVYRVPGNILEGGQPGAFRIVSKAGSTIIGYVSEAGKGIAQNTATDVLKGDTPKFVPKEVSLAKADPVKFYRALHLESLSRTPSPLTRTPSPGLQ